MWEHTFGPSKTGKAPLTTKIEHIPDHPQVGLYIQTYDENHFSRKPPWGHDVGLGHLVNFSFGSV